LVPGSRYASPISATNQTMKSKMMLSTRLTAGCLNSELHSEVSARYASEKTTLTSQSLSSTTAALPMVKSGSTMSDVTTMAMTHTSISSESTVAWVKNLPSTSDDRRARTTR